MTDEQDNGAKPQIRVGRPPIRDLLQNGDLVRFGKHYRARGMDGVTLSDLIELAEERVDPDLRLEPGRRALGEGRGVEAITRSQFLKGRAALNKVAQHLFPDLPKSTAATMVNSQYLHWNSKSGPGGLGDWAILEAVRAAGGTDQHVGDARTLCDLAATHGLLSATERHDPDYSPVPTEWAELSDRWTDAIDTNFGARWAVYRLLTGVAEALGTARSPDEFGVNDWEAVIRFLETQWLVDGSLPSARKSSVRSTYRALRSSGIVSGPEWDGRQTQKDSALCLFDSAWAEAVAFRYCWDRPDIEAQPDPDSPEWQDSPPEIASLVREGPFSLHRLVLHFTEPDSEVLQHLGIPERDVWPGEAHRGTSHRGSSPYKTRTLQANLYLLGTYLGFVVQSTDLDFGPESEATLADALSPDLLTAFYHNAPTDRSIVERIMQFLARVASPFAEGTARHEVGDEQLAERMAQTSKLANSPSGVMIDGRRRSSLARAAQKALRIKRRREASIGEREIAERTNSVWSHVMGTEFGFLGYLQLVRFLRDEVTLTALAVESFEEVVDSAADISREQARLVRASLMLQDNLVAPLRTGSMMKMPLDARRTEVDGSIVAQYPAWMMKASGAARGDFRPIYWRSGTESFYDPHLYELYRKLARPALHRGNKRFWVPDMAGREAPHSGWGGISERIPNSVLHDALKRWGEAQGVDTSPLGEIVAGARLATWHRIRHLFALYWTEHGKIQMAARMLHHASLDQIDETYGRRGASGYDPAGLLAKQL